MGQPQALRKGLGNEGRLIVSALSFALPVERDRDDNIGGEILRVASRNFGEPLSEPATERLDLLEFQQENRPDQRSLIDCEAAGAIKAVCFVLASGTERVLSLFQLQSGKRATTNSANGWRDSVERIETLRADWHAARIHEEFAAEAAISRKYYADERVACGCEPGAQAFAKTPLPARGALEGGDCAGCACFRHGREYTQFQCLN